MHHFGISMQGQSMIAHKTLTGYTQIWEFQSKLHRENVVIMPCLENSDNASRKYVHYILLFKQCFELNRLHG